MGYDVVQFPGDPGALPPGGLAGLVVEFGLGAVGSALGRLEARPLVRRACPRPTR